MKTETIVRVLQAYQTHYPAFFRDKTKADKERMILEWHQLFDDIEDRIFLIACGNLAKTMDFCPSVGQIRESIAKVQKREEWRQFQAECKKKQNEEWANMTDEHIGLLMEVDSMFGGELIDWYKVREEAKQELERS